MSYEFYKLLHVIGIITLFVGLTTILILSMTGQLHQKKARALGFAAHGVGLVLIIFAGFGMAAKLHLFADLPGWLYAKIGIWVLLGGSVALLRRRPQWAVYNALAIIFLGGLAAYLALFKPF